MPRLSIHPLSQRLLGVGLLASAAYANLLNFPFPYDAVDPVPFQASVDPAFIKETVMKAALYRPTIDLLDAEVSNADAREGPSRANMTTLAEYWAHDFDWAKREDQINGNFSHYAVTIPQGGGDYNHSVSIHFVHERSEAEDAIPLLLLHGWPSTHLEWSKVIGPLSASGDGVNGPSFHVVAPDLPGFGFSPAPTHSGLASPQLAAVFHKLMCKLGYERYGVISTDLGWWTGLNLGAVVPDSIIGHYSDFWLIQPNATDLERLANNKTTEQETRYINSFTETFANLYIHGPAHHLAPLAIGQAMSDTPVGFAGWVWHLLNLVSDGYHYDWEELITSTMMLFIQGTYGNVRLYREVFGKDFGNEPVTTVPTGAGLWASPGGPFEGYRYVYDMPREWMERIVNIVYVAEHEEGGHFPANNVPDLWVQDVRKFFGGL
ncbi:Fc.00g085000.m01.CDS01 [Cosmosporella sp. VM-42]